MKTLTFEYGGGLGDIIAQCYFRGSYLLLNELGPHCRAEVILITHNPFAHELFSLHRNAAFMNIRDLGYWDPAKDAEHRAKHGISAPGCNGWLPSREGKINWPESEQDYDRVVSAVQGKPYVVLAASAGLNERNIPIRHAEAAAQACMDAGFNVIAVGRNYDRHGRQEVRLNYANGRYVDLIDKLSVPGTCGLVQGSAGIITSHSALNLLAWYERKPQLLLYPDSVAKTHIAAADQWAFGINYPETVHSTFDGFHLGHIERFIKLL